MSRLHVVEKVHKGDDQVILLEAIKDAWYLTSVIVTGDEHVVETGQWSSRALVHTERAWIGVANLECNVHRGYVPAGLDVDVCAGLVRALGP